MPSRHCEERTNCPDRRCEEGAKRPTRLPRAKTRGQSRPAALAIFLALLFTTLLLGLLCPAIAQNVPDRIYTTPRRLVPIDGPRRLNLYCTGSGRPAVMLEAGSGNFMVTWRHVQAAIAQFTHVCAYDRAGLGFSDPAARPSTTANIADDLHRLIQAAHIPTPIVFVGHSLGGEVGELFVKTWPTEIAGMVLVDPGFPDMLRVLQAALPPASRTTLMDGFHRMLDSDRACLALAEQGALTRPATKTAAECVIPTGSPDRLDHTLLQAASRQLARPATWAAMISETESFVPNGDQPSTDSNELAWTGLSFGNMPLIVLTRGRQEGAPGVPPSAVAAMEAAWKAGHDRLAALSTRGVSRVVPDTGHYIQVEQPGSVIRAVRTVVTAVRHE